MRRRISTLAGATAGALLLAGCGSGAQPSASRSDTPAPTSASTPTHSSAPSASSSRSTSAAVSGPAFMTMGMSGKGASGATVRSIRVAKHEGYDRLVVDLDGRAPAWRASYQLRFFQDGSGAPVPIRGVSGLQVVLQAQGHDQNYRPTYTGPRISRSHLPTLKEWAVTGDFEGQFTLGLALNKRAAYRVFSLSNPTRLVIDVQH